MTYNEEIGQRIHDLRKKNKISMKELGSKVNLHESTISRYEKGEIQSLDIDKLKEFAKALNTTPSYLMGWDSKYNDYIAYEIKLPNSTEIVSRIKKVISLLETMSNDELEQVDDYIEFIISKRKDK